MASKYKKILDNIEYSFSSLHLYNQCKYAFYLKKVCEIVGVNNAYQEIGSYGHSLNEQIFKKEMTVQQALDDCVENFDDYVFEYISDSSKEKKYIALCDYLSVFDESYEERFEIIGVEMEFHWRIGKYKCVGYADLILKNKETGKIYLIDHKSASHFMKKDGTPLKNQEDNFCAYRYQMYMYCDAIKKKLGLQVDYIVWSHFLDNSSVTMIPFDENEYNESLDWVVSTIKKIYRDNEFEAKENYMLCFRLCDFRDNICEYKELRMEEGE